MSLIDNIPFPQPLVLSRTGLYRKLVTTYLSSSLFFPVVYVIANTYSQTPEQRRETIQKTITNALWFVTSIPKWFLDWAVVTVFVVVLVFFGITTLLSYVFVTSHRGIKYCEELDEKIAMQNEEPVLPAEDTNHWLDNDLTLWGWCWRVFIGLLITALAMLYFFTTIMPTRQPEPVTSTEPFFVVKRLADPYMYPIYLSAVVVLYVVKPALKTSLNGKMCEKMGFSSGCACDLAHGIERLVLNTNPVTYELLGEEKGHSTVAVRMGIIAIITVITIPLYQTAIATYYGGIQSKTAWSVSVSMAFIILVFVYFIMYLLGVIAQLLGKKKQGASEILNIEQLF